MEKLIRQQPAPPPDALTFRVPADADWTPKAFTMPVPPGWLPQVPRGKMTRRKRVRLRKKYNKLRRLARVGRVRLVIRSYTHATVVLKEENPDE
jgi:hypothetical protein